MAAAVAERSEGVDQDAGFAVDDLVLNPADAAGHHRPRLPHRLGDRQPEPLGEALLEHDVGSSLDRVHDRRVLLQVVHRQAGEMYASLSSAGSAARCARVSARTSAPSGSSATSATDGPASNRCAPGCRTRSVNARSTPAGSLRRSQRETWTTSGTWSGTGPAWSSSAARSTRPWVPVLAHEHGRRPIAVGKARPRQDRADGPVSHLLILRREGVDRGRDHPQFPFIEAVPGERSAREHVRVGRFDVRQQEAPGLPSQLVRMVESHMTAPDDVPPGRSQRAAQSRVCGS